VPSLYLLEDQRLGDDLGENCRSVEEVAEQLVDDQRLVAELVDGLVEALAWQVEQTEQLVED